jgi:hypothetical protein
MIRKRDDDLFHQPAKPAYAGWPMVSLVVALGVALVGMMMGWYFFHRAEIRQKIAVTVAFTEAPDTLQAQVAARFVFRAERSGENGAPAAGRLVDFKASPPDGAQIISVTGASGIQYPALSSSAMGHTDSAGNIVVMVKAARPGRYTLTGVDSAARSDATVNFQAR